MTDNALMVVSSLDDTLKLGKVLAESGYFSDAKQTAQAVVKVLAGMEMGFGPIASMNGVHIIQGKPSVGANLLGAAVKRTGRYNYQVATLTDEKAEIIFFENGKEIGRSVFSMEDAAKAGLNGKDNWRKFPRNMLFARAMSNGARWYCPDVFGGVTPYTPEELGADVDGETGEVIDVTPTVVQQAAKRPVDGIPPPNGKRPYPAEAIRDKIREKGGWFNEGGEWQRDMAAEAVTEHQIGGVNGLLVNALDNITDRDSQSNARHEVLRYLVDVNSASSLTKKEASAIITWLKSAQEEDWTVNSYARAEVAGILVAVAAEAGQEELPL